MRHAAAAAPLTPAAAMAQAKAAIQRSAAGPGALLAERLKSAVKSGGVATARAAAQWLAREIESRTDAFARRAAIEQAHQLFVRSAAFRDAFAHELPALRPFLFPAAARLATSSDGDGAGGGGGRGGAGDAKAMRELDEFARECYAVWQTVGRLNLPPPPLLPPLPPSLGEDPRSSMKRGGGDDDAQGRDRARKAPRDERMLSAAGEDGVNGALAAFAALAPQLAELSDASRRIAAELQDASDLFERKLAAVRAAKSEGEAVEWEEEEEEEEEEKRAGSGGRRGAADADDAALCADIEAATAETAAVTGELHVAPSAKPASTLAAASASPWWTLSLPPSSSLPPCEDVTGLAAAEAEAAAAASAGVRLGQEAVALARRASLCAQAAQRVLALSDASALRRAEQATRGLGAEEALRRAQRLCSELGALRAEFVQPMERFAIAPASP